MDLNSRDKSFVPQKRSYSVFLKNLHNTKKNFILKFFFQICSIQKCPLKLITSAYTILKNWKFIFIRNLNIKFVQHNCFFIFEKNYTENFLEVKIDLNLKFFIWRHKFCRLNKFKKILFKKRCSILIIKKKKAENKFNKLLTFKVDIFD